MKKPDLLANDALEKGLDNLLRYQLEEGAFEGEVIWCPMLAAQYAIMCHLTGQALPETRRRRLLLQFERTQLADGLWGLHPHSPPYLFTTALVYVAARLLGVERGDPLLRWAEAWFRAQPDGVVGIPSWGKFWLAMVGLYDWSGVNAVLPEAWLLPRSFPLHPSNYYCHTRMIYMGLAAIYGQRFVGPKSPVIDELREELFPQGYETVDFRKAKNTLREAEIFTPPSKALRALYAVSGLVDRGHHGKTRARVLADLRERIRWEFRTTDHTCLSPVNGLLNLIVLYLDDPNDPDYLRGLEKFEGWIWEDDIDGLRVAGARSASWDTAFALQALTRLQESGIDRTGKAKDAMVNASSFLHSQQIDRSFHGYEAQYRVNPKGGYCFAGVWHGWPVSDCTAEAVEALIHAEPIAGRPEQGRRVSFEDATRFILQCQNHDGGFGSYEAMKQPMGLEWINPAEMFGDSMTELSYTECTASCMAALRLLQSRVSGELYDRAATAIARGEAQLRKAQRTDGAWSGCWGVHFSYGTWFGIRGLRAAGAGGEDAAIRRACRFLCSIQRPDGGFGEHYESSLRDDYIPHEDAQTLQTAWALLALLEAGGEDWDAIERAATFLMRAQSDDGSFPRQDMAGIFFHTALLEYADYRHIFPLWALSNYEIARQARQEPRDSRGARATNMVRGVQGGSGTGEIRSAVQGEPRV